MKIAEIIAAACIVLGIAGRPLINYLVRQSEHPEGFVGRIMTKIWSGYFKDLNKWGNSLVHLDDAKKVLNVGFGGGSGVKEILDRKAGHTVYGVDISEEALRTATKLNQDYVKKGQALLGTGDVANLTFEDDFFDLVIAGQSHIYWEELEKGLAECYRVTREGGTFLITCENEKIAYHLSKYRDDKTFQALLAEIGFSKVTISNHNKSVAFICVK